MTTQTSAQSSAMDITRGIELLDNPLLNKGTAFSDTAFLAACPPWWRPYFTLAFWTGARPNELAALYWGDVDTARGILRIRAGLYRGKEGPPKTASSVRDIDLLPAVVEALKAQKAQQAAERLKRGRGAPEAGQDYVFTGPEGSLLNVNALRDRVWYPTLTKAALTRRTMYPTRHTFASNALAAGEAPSWVAATLGPASPDMLFSVYAGMGARSCTGWRRRSWSRRERRRPLRYSRNTPAELRADRVD